MKIQNTAYAYKIKPQQKQQVQFEGNPLKAVQQVYTNGVKRQSKAFGANLFLAK